MLVVLLLVAVAAALTQQNGEGRSTLRSRDVSGTPLLRSYGPSESVNVWSTDDAYFSGVPPGKSCSDPAHSASNTCYKSFEKLRMEDLRHPLGKLTPDTELGEQARAKVKELARSVADAAVAAAVAAAARPPPRMEPGTPRPRRGSRRSGELAGLGAAFGVASPAMVSAAAALSFCCCCNWSCDEGAACVCLKFFAFHCGSNNSSSREMILCYESLVDRKNEAPKVTVPPSGSSGSLGLHVAAASFACAAAVLLLTS
ncbi:hypothetical protein ACSSS7_002769 [Eimeria intestinalis]